MEELSLTPHASAPRASTLRSQAIGAYENAAWRAPEPRRFDDRVVNEWSASVAEPELDWTLDNVPGWVVVVAGGIVAAILGAILGGVLAL